MKNIFLEEILKNQHLNKKFKIQNILAISITILVLLCYFISFTELSLDIPIGDDFPAFVDLTPASVNGNLSTKDFFSQINEHRVLYDRIYWITGIKLFNTVNFQALQLIGNLSLIMLLLFFVKIGKLGSNSIWLIPTVAFVLFSWVGYSNSLCAMMALQNYGFPLFVCVGLWFMATSSDIYKTLLGLLILSLAFFTTGIGFISIGFGLSSLLIRKNYKALGYSSLISIVVIIAYFAFYTPSPVQSSIFSGLSQPFELLKRYFAFVGGILPISSLSPIPEIMLGIVLFSALCFSLIRLKKEAPHALLLITIFFLLLAAIVVAARFELNEYIANRFKINSAIIFICIIILFVKSLPQNKIRSFIIVGITFFTASLNLFNYKSFNDYRFWVDEFATDLLNVNHGLNTTAFLPKKGDYISKSFYSDEFQMVYSGLKETEVLKTSIPIVLEQNSEGKYLVNNWAGMEMKIIKRPAVLVSGVDGNVLGFLPINHTSGSCNDLSEIIKSNTNCSFFLVNLKP